MPLSDPSWQISQSTLIAGLFWAAGGAVTAATCAGLLDRSFSSVGIILVMFGCMMQLKRWMRRCTIQATDAFELGRASMQIVRD